MCYLEMGFIVQLVVGFRNERYFQVFNFRFKSKRVCNKEVEVYYCCLRLSDFKFFSVVCSFIKMLELEGSLWVIRFNVFYFQKWKIRYLFLVVFFMCGCIKCFCFFMKILRRYYFVF